jgi:hypothetical protein
MSEENAYIGRNRGLTMRRLGEIDIGFIYCGWELSVSSSGEYAGSDAPFIREAKSRLMVWAGGRDHVLHSEKRAGPSERRAEVSPQGFSNLGASETRAEEYLHAE